eukprot:CAMPEP_0168356418 /NCGR_PEP_ID=MMETSP0228-20121227/21_1 /TAXON_ID=133427 /ORGANISM="Protoceratium reticulatum, Strain CCCM 535 (=CCMP 1889)" /LENGTH=351 /DNA_ID=CAMNT_0008368825 /DNA_START=64 /DNA_END=1118 /DNA_ORIENTATION=+
MTTSLKVSPPVPPLRSPHAKEYGSLYSEAHWLFDGNSTPPFVVQLSINKAASTFLTTFLKGYFQYCVPHMIDAHAVPNLDMVAKHPEFCNLTVVGGGTVAAYLQELRNNLEMKTCGIINGHDKLSNLIKHAPAGAQQSDVYTVTLLRDPVERVLSQYFYGENQPWLPVPIRQNGLAALAEGKLEDAYTNAEKPLLENRELPVSPPKGNYLLWHNLQTVYLDPNIDTTNLGASPDALARAQQRLGELTAFGITKYMRASLCLISHKLGLFDVHKADMCTDPTTDTFERKYPHENKGRNPGLDEFNKTFPGLPERLVHSFQNDVALYGTAESLFLDQVARLEQETGLIFKEVH